MSEDHTERTPDPGRSDAATTPVPRRLPLAFGIPKGGQPKRDEPGAPGSFSQLLALRFATRGTGVQMVDLDAQGTGTRPRWVDH